MKLSELNKINSGLTLVPLKGKIPAIQGWQKRVGQSETEIESWEANGWEAGIVCNDGLEVVDIDSKFQLMGDNIMNRWCEKVMEQDSELIKKLVISRTVSGGFHAIYRCTDVEIPGNKKLASRPLTGAEKAVDNPPKSVCLIETRGRGGQIKAYPAIKNGYDSIPVITTEERGILIDSAYSMNEIIKEPVERREKSKRIGGLSPMDDYDQSNDSSVILALLEEYGWTVYRDKGSHYELTRPGKDSGVSGTLDFFPNLFYTWSGAGQFEENQGYTYAGVYTQLVHDGDTYEATKALAREGYGEQISDRESKELVDKMLGKKEEELSDDDIAAVMAQISCSRDEMDSYLTYLKTARDFRLSDKYYFLNKIMKDIQPGYYVGWAAASGVGKTSTTRQVFNDYLNATDQDGLFFTMELKSRELALRNAQESRSPDNEDYVDKDVTNKMLVSDVSFRESIINDWSNFYSIETAYDVKVMFEMAKVFKGVIAKKGRKLGVVAIDFVQMAKGGHNIESQPEIASFLKYMAKHLDTIVVGILQLNSTIGKFEEPNENHISGHKALFQTSDFGYLLWKNQLEPRRIIVASKKERHSLAGRCDLVQVGMKIHSEEHKEITSEEKAYAKGNRGI